MWVEKRDTKVRYCEEYKDPLTDKRKKVSITFDKDTAANQRLALEHLTNKINSLKLSPEHDSITLRALCDLYCDYQKIVVKLSTYRRNLYSCNSICEILGANTLLERLTAQYVNHAMLATGKTATALNELLKRFKALINWAYKNEYLNDISFLLKLDRFPDSSPRERIKDKYLEPDEAKLLLDSMSNSTHWQLVTEFLLLSGLRSGEAFALSNSDIDFDSHVIHVTKTFDPNNRILTPPKTLTSIRDVYLQPELYTLCKRIKVLSNCKKLELGVKNDLFLIDASGTRINYRCYEKYLTELSERILKHRITSHALRHTHASLLLSSGVSIDTISRRLGHDNSKITKEIYLHVTKKLISADNEQLKLVNIL